MSTPCIMNNKTPNIKDNLSVQVKSKKDPEALLNDLSTSLKSFQSTVRIWTQSSTLTPSTTSTDSLNNSSLRPARLGLGAKVQRNQGGTSGNGGGVGVNMILKKQLTGNVNSGNGISASASGLRTYGKYGDAKVGKSTKAPSTTTKVKNNNKVRPKRDFSDDECGGRASLIKKTRK